MTDASNAGACEQGAAPARIARVGFILLSSSSDPAPSTRIAVLNVLPLLEAMGIATEILFDPPAASETPDLGPAAERILAAECDTVVFQKVRGPSATALAARLRAAGVRTVNLVCDLVNEEMVRGTDATVVVTEYLRSLHSDTLRNKIHVVHDGIERPEVVAAGSGAADRVSGLVVTSHTLYRLPILGRPPPGYRITVVGRFPPDGDRLERLKGVYRALAEAHDVRERAEILAFAAHRRLCIERWDPDGVYRRIVESDVGLIPALVDDVPHPLMPVPAWRLKSENRLTLMMAAGLPVVATPIPAYEAVLVHGQNGFLAATRRDWFDCCQRLRDEGLRREIGKRARASVLNRFSMRRQAEILASVLVPVIAKTTSAYPESIAWARESYRQACNSSSCDGDGRG